MKSIVFTIYLSFSLSVLIAQSSQSKAWKIIQVIHNEKENTDDTLKCMYNKEFFIGSSQLESKDYEYSLLNFKDTIYKNIIYIDGNYKIFKNKRSFINKSRIKVRYTDESQKINNINALKAYVRFCGNKKESTVWFASDIPFYKVPFIEWFDYGFLNGATLEIDKKNGWSLKTISIQEVDCNVFNDIFATHKNTKDLAELIKLTLK